MTTSRRLSVGTRNCLTHSSSPLPCCNCRGCALHDASWSSGIQGLRHVAALRRDIRPNHQKQPCREHGDPTDSPAKTKVQARQGQSQSLIGAVLLKRRSESARSWKELPLDPKRRGLAIGAPPSSSRKMSREDGGTLIDYDNCEVIEISMPLVKFKQPSNEDMIVRLHWPSCRRRWKQAKSLSPKMTS